MTPRKILIAEDDVDDRDLLTAFLSDRKDIVLMPMVENGVEIIEALDKIKVTTSLPDMIVLDHNMPKRNGLQTLKLLKSTDQYSSIPVMVYSTYIDDSLEKLCAANGAAIITTKPFTKKGYHEMIDEFLSAAKSVEQKNAPGKTTAG
jgi:CheY-like chemotaxis protein